MAITLGELVLPLTGIGLAASAAAFAVVMIGDSDSAPRINGAEHLAIFGKPSAGVAVARAGAPPAGRADLDPQTVGSIAARTPARPDPRPGQAGQVIGLFEGKALVEVPSGYALIEPGRLRPQVGDRIPLVSRSGKWVVATGDLD